MAIVSWQSKLDCTVNIGKKPVAKGGMAGVYFEDYELHDGYWRYTWTNFTLEPNPEFVDVYLMESE